MAKRQVNGLLWARRCERPACVPIGRPRGAKAAGVRYERALARALGGTPGQWFEFEDTFGRGYCQVDLLLERGEALVVVEAKYTWTREAHSELAGLYLPVVAMALGRTPIGVVACKVLVPGMPYKASGNLGDCIAGRAGVFHWIGVGPRRTRALPRRATRLSPEALGL